LFAVREGQNFENKTIADSSIRILYGIEVNNHVSIFGSELHNEVCVPYTISLVRFLRAILLPYFKGQHLKRLSPPKFIISIHLMPTVVQFFKKSKTVNVVVILIEPEVKYITPMPISITKQFSHLVGSELHFSPLGFCLTLLEHFKGLSKHYLKTAVHPTIFALGLRANLDSFSYFWN
jgi:hypothetical protein